MAAEQTQCTGCGCGEGEYHRRGCPNLDTAHVSPAAAGREGYAHPFDADEPLPRELRPPEPAAPESERESDAARAINLIGGDAVVTCVNSEVEFSCGPDGIARILALAERARVAEERAEKAERFVREVTHVLYAGTAPNMPPETVETRINKIVDELHDLRAEVERLRSAAETKE